MVQVAPDELCAAVSNVTRILRRSRIDHRGPRTVFSAFLPDRNGPRAP
jgi:hypothetical protein